ALAAKRRPGRLRAVAGGEDPARGPAAPPLADLPGHDLVLLGGAEMARQDLNGGRADRHDQTGQPGEQPAPEQKARSTAAPTPRPPRPGISGCARWPAPTAV